MEGSLTEQNRLRLWYYKYQPGFPLFLAPTPPMARRPSEPQQTLRMPTQVQAWHEAGHALAAHLLGGVVREVTLESELDGLEGHVAVEWHQGAHAIDARRFAAVALAGPVAELICLGRDALLDPEALASWERDWAEARTQLESLHPDSNEREKTLRKILRELHEMLGTGQGYERLARVADALDAHGTLDASLFEEACG